MTEKFRENRRPLLSVIVPVYNGAAWLRETLESIRNSRYENLELLLIDDGSADGSGEICREYERKDPRVRYIRKENGGIVSARNLGLDAAGGTYLCFCDQDDEVDEQMYDILIRRMEEAEAQIGVCSTGRRINGEKSRYESVTDGCFHGEAVLEAVLYPILFRGYEFSFYKREHYLYGTLWKCVFRRDFLKAHGMRFRSFVDYEDDWLFVTEALCHAGTVVTAGRIGYYWTVNETSRSHKRRFIPDLGERVCDGLSGAQNLRPGDSGQLSENTDVRALRGGASERTGLRPGEKGLPEKGADLSGVQPLPGADELSAASR